MDEDDPEQRLTRAGFMLVLGAALAGLSQSRCVAPDGLASHALLVAAGALIFVGGVATARCIHDHSKHDDR